MYKLSKFLTIFLIITLLSLTSISNALELGALGVYYEEDEPFYVEVAVTDLSDLDPKDISINIVQNEAEYFYSSIPYNNYIPSLTTEFVKVNKNEGVIKIRYQSSIKYNDIAFILEVIWPGGARVREYSTIKLDFSQQNKETNEPYINESITALPTVNVKKIDIVEQDNLENIAHNIKIAFFPNEDIALEQIMTAIRRYNSNALSVDNSYMLLPGSQIITPNYEQITEQSAQDAIQEIKTFYRPFFNNIKTKVYQKPTDFKKTDRLTLTQTNDKSNVSSKREQLALLNLNKQDLLAKVNELNQQIKDLDTAIQIKNQQLARTENNINQISDNQTFLEKIISFIQYLFEIVKQSPVMWIAFAIIIVLLIFVIKMIFFSISDEEVDYDQDFEIPVDQNDFQNQNVSNNKLEIAKAFINMENYEAAKGILNEIINDSQSTKKAIQQANVMLNSFS